MPGLGSPTKSPVTGATCPGSVQWIGDGLCDHLNNNPQCDYDGGDCCVRDPNTYFCDPANTMYGDDVDPCTCLDPAMSGPDEYGCMVGFIGDGVCDPQNNREEVCMCVRMYVCMYL
jgi:hypothetical protein